MKHLAWKTALIALTMFLYLVPSDHAGYWPLAYVCLVPFCIAVLHRPGRAELWLAALAWCAWIVLGLRWLRPFGTVAWVVTPLFYVLSLPLFGPVLRRTRRWTRLPLVLLLPVLFTAAEWLRTEISPGKLPLLLLGYTQIKLTPLIQIVDVTGVYGLTFLVAAYNGWFADLGMTALEGGRSVRTRLPRLAVSGGALLLLTGGLLAYGVVRDTEEHWHKGPRVAVVQPNLPHYPPNQRQDNIRVYDLEVIYTLSKVPRKGVDMVLWPENALLDLLEEKGTYRENYARDLKYLARTFGAALVVDAAELPPGEQGSTFHTAFFVNREGEIADKTRKVYLLPWTEYIPLADALDWVFLGNPFRRLVVGSVGFVPYGRRGRLDDVRVFQLDWAGGTTSFGVPICFESATPALTREMARKGAEFLVNPASEGSLGKSIYRQTLINNGFRAVENRMTVVRATNTGISAILDSNGRVREVLRGTNTGAIYDEPGVMVADVILDDRAGKTVYCRIGDAFVYGVSLAAGLLWVLAEMRGMLGARGPDGDRDEAAGQVAG